MLTICSWYRAAESQKGASMSNKKDLRDLPGIGNSDSQVPFPSCLLAGHQWSRDTGLLGDFPEDARHARLSTGSRLPSWSHMRSQAGVWGNMDEEVVRLGSSPHAD